MVDITRVVDAPLPTFPWFTSHVRCNKGDAGNQVKNLFIEDQMVSKSSNSSNNDKEINGPNKMALIKGVKGKPQKENRYHGHQSDKKGFLIMGEGGLHLLDEPVDKEYVIYSLKRVKTKKHDEVPNGRR